MTLNDARALFAVKSAPFTRREHSHPNEALLPAYDAASETDKIQMVEAAKKLLIDGTADEQDLGASFLRFVPLDPQAWSRLIDAYSSGRFGEADALPRFLEVAADHFTDADVARLEQLFLSNPRAHLRMAGIIIVRRPASPVWTELKDLVQSSTDPTDLALACRAMDACGRTQEFINAMRTKPKDVQTATVQRMASVHYSSFFADEIAAALG